MKETDSMKQFSMMNGNNTNNNTNNPMQQSYFTTQTTPMKGMDHQVHQMQRTGLPPSYNPINPVSSHPHHTSFALPHSTPTSQHELIANKLHSHHNTPQPNQYPATMQQNSIPLPTKPTNNPLHHPFPPVQPSNARAQPLVPGFPSSSAISPFPPNPAFPLSSPTIQNFHAPTSFPPTTFNPSFSSPTQSFSSAPSFSTHSSPFPATPSLSSFTNPITLNPQQQRLLTTVGMSQISPALPNTVQSWQTGYTNGISPVNNTHNTTTNNTHNTVENGGEEDEEDYDEEDEEPVVKRKPSRKKVH